MSLPPEISEKLRLPLICAPMFLVSGPQLVIEACRSGIIGGIPAHNARTTEQFAEWMAQIHEALSKMENPGPLAVNISTPKLGGRRWPDDMAIIEEYKVPLVITAIGDPSEVVERVHAYGGRILHDATILKHARKAVEAGVDGLNVICGGGGGHSGLLNPFTFVPQVREFFDGILVLAGAMSDGRAMRAAQVLGADLIYMGTRFIATQESLADQRYKALLVRQTSEDIIYTPAISGIPASWMKGSLTQAGLDPDHLPPLKEKMQTDLPDGLIAWRDVWSAGQGVGQIHDIPSVAELVGRIEQEYRNVP